MAAESCYTIPTLDLSPFLCDGRDDAGRKKAMEIVANSCKSYGFFRVANHGVPPRLMARALDLSKIYFQNPDEEKLKSKPVIGSDSPLPAGYSRQPEMSADKNEFLLMSSPELGFNIYPSEPPDFREVLEETFKQLTKTALLVQDILNDCMGLPPSFLSEYNRDRGYDFMTALRYFPATDTENNGLTEHQDGNCITFVFQDDVGGLEVLKDGEWIQAAPEEESIIVNVGDIIQVLSNDKFKSAMHRVVRRRVHRHSYAFFFNLDGEKLIEPLPQFTEDIGESPKYRAFLYKEYLQLRMRNKTHPPSRPEDVIHVSHYAIPV